MSARLAIARETARRGWRKSLRRPVPLAFSLVQPLWWMLIFGFLFHRYDLGPGYFRIPYLTFVLPGICAMTVLFGASQAGIDLVRDLQTGFVQRMVRSTAHPGWILAGKLAADVSRLLAQALVVGMIGKMLGARLWIDWGAVLVGGVGLALFAAAYGSLSCWIALRTRAPESMAVFVHVLNMPLLFTSTALVPSRQMPGWLAAVAQWNPLTLVSDALRQALLFGRLGETWGMLLPLAILAALLFALARHAMARAAED
ncbi:MAG TPA: ABC transporter permease [Longimicrobium sp.]|uniref:ABC transporter permease n=1 Tax=Longimicrobium sp. TaxID=2029185 RepID=UPI002EDB08A1